MKTLFAPNNSNGKCQQHCAPDKDALFRIPCISHHCRYAHEHHSCASDNQCNWCGIKAYRIQCIFNLRFSCNFPLCEWSWANWWWCWSRPPLSFVFSSRTMLCILIRIMKTIYTYRFSANERYICMDVICILLFISHPECTIIQFGSIVSRNKSNGNRKSIFVIWLIPSIGSKALQNYIREALECVCVHTDIAVCKKSRCWSNPWRLFAWLGFCQQCRGCCITMNDLIWALVFDACDSAVGFDLLIWMWVYIVFLFESGWFPIWCNSLVSKADIHGVFHRWSQKSNWTHIQLTQI